MLAMLGFNFAAVAPLATIGFKFAATLTALATIGLLILLFLAAGKLFSSNKKGKTSTSDQAKKRRSAPPASWHKPSHRSRKQKHKVYVAAVIKRKWRTPRRSSH